jgi:hypothetical protein
MPRGQSEGTRTTITTDEAALVRDVLGTRGNRKKYANDAAFWRALDKYTRLADGAAASIPTNGED